MTAPLDNAVSSIRARVKQVSATPMTERSHAVSVACAFAGPG